MDIVATIIAGIARIKKEIKMENKQSLNVFMNEIETNYPDILPLIKSKNENSIEIELEGGWKTFEEQSRVLNPILNASLKFSIKSTQVSYVEKYNYYKIIVKLR